MWRNSYCRPRLLGLDARLFVIFMMGLLHLREWVFITLGVLVVAMVFIEIWRGVTIEVWLKMIRSGLAGNRRPGWNGQDRRVAIDYGAAEQRIFDQDD
ncbi:MAG: IcmT/TraK family protein [Rhodospirillales bacterium]|nr:IcmT/TraK family protein [Rhodospirillales bacterium]